MADRLILHYDAQRAAWLGAEGALERGTLEQAADAAGEREVVLLIPGEQVLLTAVHLPPIRQARRRQQAAAYALEDQLVARVDTLHVALAARPGADGDTAAAVIDRERLAGYLDAAANAGLDVVQVYPDTMLVPAPEADAWQIAILDGRVLARVSAVHGFAAEASLWPALAAGSPPAPDTIHLHGADAAAMTEIAGVALEPAPGVERHAYDDENALLAALLADFTSAGAINLRQGSFARTSAMQTWWQPFKLTAGLAAAWLIIAVAARGLEAWQLHQRIDALQATSEAAFHDAFPEVQTINDLRVQAEQKIRELRGSGASGGVFPLLQATAEVTGQAGDMRIQSLQYRDGTLYLSLRGDNVQALEALRAGFARQPATELNVESADAASDGVQIRASVTGIGA